MHEVAIAQGILDLALDLADGQTLRTIRVSAGELLAVSEDSLQFGFELVAQDTPAATARLEVNIVPGDGLLIDAIESEDGWTTRPEAVAS